MRKVILSLIISITIFVSTSLGNPDWNKIKSLEYQLFIREWGKISSICSAGIYYADKNVIRLLTAGHCITYMQQGDELPEFSVSQDGFKFYPIKVLAAGWNLNDRGEEVTKNGDWAILEMKNEIGLAPISLLDDRERPALGEAIYAVSYPASGDSTAVQGIVSNPKYRAPQTKWNNYISITIASTGGSSGTVLFNSNNKVVGIIVAGLDANFHLATYMGLIKEKVPCLAQPVCNFKKSKKKGGSPD